MIDHSISPRTSSRTRGGVRSIGGSYQVSDDTGGAMFRADNDLKRADIAFMMR